MPEDTASRVSISSLSIPDIVLFIAQVFVIVIVIIISLVNLTMAWGNQNLWTAFVMASMGYIMPNPKLKLSSFESLKEQKL
jgi:hypothetical protein